MAQTAEQKAEAAEKAAEEQEAKRVAELEAQVKANRKRYKLIERNLHFTTIDGTEIVVPLTMKVKTYRAMTESTLGGFEQLYEFVFVPLGIAHEVDELDMFDITLLVNAWFHEFRTLQGAQSLGE